MTGNSKLKIIYILEIMKKTDEHHPINTTQIAEKLASYGIQAERKSIARDIRCLEDAGFSIAKCVNHNDGWYMFDQEFEDHELKMLVDAVASAKFLTMEDSRRLIKKLKKLATKDGEEIINATLIIDENLKLQDRKFNLKFDTIMRAITHRHQIRFRYMDRNSGSKQKLRYNGYFYQVSPYFIVLRDEEYFLICNLNNHRNSTSFRIELMTDVGVLNLPARSMEETEDLKDIGRIRPAGDFLRQSVHLWTGEAEPILLRGINACRINLTKAFGNHIVFRDDGEGYFLARIKIARNEGFYQWLAAYGDNIRIQSPQIAVDEFKEYLKRTMMQYE